MNVPEWLKLHDGSLRQGLSDDTQIVLFSGQPQYRLTVRPAGGKFTCAVVQIVNGSRVDSGREYPTVEAAFQGGLEELRLKLGW